MRKTLLCLLSFLPVLAMAQVSISITKANDKKAISPYLYGMNSSLMKDFSNPFGDAQWTQLKDAGVQMVRIGGGNNSTKYNWRNRLSSHPNWYNNVYDNNWDAKMKSIQEQIPAIQSMWTFQLIGKTAKSANFNFNDWNYNQSQWWAGCEQNLAGGGTPNTSSSNPSKAAIEGDTSKYLISWPADSTVGILNYWFGSKGLAYKKDKAVYWEMDNEPEIWSGTHDDVFPVQPSAEDFMQMYFKVAKAARALYPNIKLCGPVMANEWQWYNYGSGISYKNKKYNWSEYFILRISEEQAASGIRLLDVFNVHCYPDVSTNAEILQTHRVFFDKQYAYPNANGIKNITGTWDNSLTNEYYFDRVNTWLKQYLGDNHGVGLGLSEIDVKSSNANVTACWYASMLGEFMKNGVEVFTPWSWKTGMWEVLHLFTQNAKGSYVQASSSNEALVSAYPSLNANGDSLSVFLVNRSESLSQEATLNFQDFSASAVPTSVYTIKNLPSTETFVSHSNNAMLTSTLTPSAGSLKLSLAPLSVTAVAFKIGAVTGIGEAGAVAPSFEVYPNPVPAGTEICFKSPFSGKASIELIDAVGRKVFSQTCTLSEGKNTLGKHDLPKGCYLLQLQFDGRTYCKKLIVD